MYGSAEVTVTLLLSAIVVHLRFEWKKIVLTSSSAELGMEKILFATGNKGKVEEMTPRFNEKGLELEQIQVDIAEIHAVDVEDVARRKVKDSFEAAVEQGLIEEDEMVIVEDTGFFVEALDGFPGAEASFFAGTAGVEKLIPMLENEDDRSAYFKTALAAYIPEKDEIKVFKGRMTGKVPGKERGESHPHLPYNTYFIPDHGNGSSLAEKPELKNQEMHRWKATEKFLDWLDG